MRNDFILLPKRTSIMAVVREHQKQVKAETEMGNLNWIIMKEEG